MGVSTRHRRAVAMQHGLTSWGELPIPDMGQRSYVDLRRTAVERVPKWRPSWQSTLRHEEPRARRTPPRVRITCSGPGGHRWPDLFTVASSAQAHHGATSQPGSLNRAGRWRWARTGGSSRSPSQCSFRSGACHRTDRGMGSSAGRAGRTGTALHHRDRAPRLAPSRCTKTLPASPTTRAGHTVAGNDLFLGSPAALIVLSRRMWHDLSWRGRRPTRSAQARSSSLSPQWGWCPPARPPRRFTTGQAWSKGSWVVALLFPCRIALGDGSSLDRANQLRDLRRTSRPLRTASSTETVDHTCRRASKPASCASIRARRTSRRCSRISAAASNASSSSRATRMATARATIAATAPMTATPATITPAAISRPDVVTGRGRHSRPSSGW